jgi:general stress protein YciG
MSARIAGVEPQKTNNEDAAQELAPDLPPRPVDSADQGDAAAKPRRPRGFAAMDRTLVSEIARKGGKAAHSAGTAHDFTSDEARDAGRKGGRATHAKRREAQGQPVQEQEKAES